MMLQCDDDDTDDNDCGGGDYDGDIVDQYLPRDTEMSKLDEQFHVGYLAMMMTTIIMMSMTTRRIMRIK